MFLHMKHTMMMRQNTADVVRNVPLLLLLFLFLLPACDEEEKYSTSYPCSFVFYCSNHPDCALSLAVTNPGQMVIVYPQLRDGVTHLILIPNQGNWTSQQTDVAMVTAIENDRLSYDRMGASRRLVIGMSNFNGLKCYDGHCPRCLSTGTTGNYPLHWLSDGKLVECSNCQAQYNTDAEGVAVNAGEESLRLIEYRIEYNGTQLYAHN